MANQSIGNKSKLRICLISSEYPPETGWGGIGTYTHNLAYGLASAGHNVTVISQATDRPVQYDDKGVNIYRIFDKKLPIKGISRILNIVSMGLFAPWWHSKSFFLKLEGLIKQRGYFDIIEGPLWLGECCAYSKKIQTPLIIRLQTPIFKSREILGLPPSRIEFLEKKSLQKANKIIAISDSIAQLVSKKYRIDPQKIIVSPLGINCPPIIRPLFRKNSYKLLYVGRLEQRKGTQELVEALPEILSQNHKITVDIVGQDCHQAPGNISYFEYFAKKVPEKFRNRVKFHGFVSDWDLQEFYRNCDLFIAPSRYESFGLIFLEAMAYGKPVIGTKTGGISEIVADGKVGLLVEVNNPGQIAKSVLKIFASEQLREKLGKQSFKHVREKFTKEQMVESTLKIYKRTIREFNNQ